MEILQSSPSMAAVDRDVPDAWRHRGKWYNGTWRLILRSPEASSLRVHFAALDLGAGELRIYAPGQNTRFDPPLTGRGQRGDSDQWTASVASDIVIVEYHPGESTLSLPFRIEAVAHFGKAGAVPAAKAGRERESFGAQCTTPYADAFPAWKLTASPVALLVFNVPSLKVWALCTGVIVSDRADSGRGYLLTANHCLNGDTDLRTLTAYLYVEDGYPTRDNGYDLDLHRFAYFGFGGVGGDRILVTAPRSEGDVTLLALDSNFANSRSPAAKWSPAEIAYGATAVAVHHPRGALKRLSTGVTSEASNVRVDGVINPRDYFFTTTWNPDAGTAEPGSSGAPLFYSDREIRGILHSAPANTCSVSPPWYANFGRMSTFLPRVQSYLNNSEPGACQVAINAGNQAIAATGASGNFTITIPANCNWAVASDTAWITITSPKAGTGNATVTYMVARNDGANSAPRLGTVSVIGEQRRVIHFSQAGVADATLTDVPTSHSFHKEISFLSANGGLADLCGAHQFCPEGTTTRGVMAQFIIRSIYGGDAGIPAPSPTPAFADVPGTHPLYKFVQEMKLLGITAGCSATEYCPDRPVTRGEMSVFVVRALQVKNYFQNVWLSTRTEAQNRLARRDVLIRQAAFVVDQFSYSNKQSFTDVSNRHSFYSFIQRMKDLGITSGCSATTYCPDDPNTRGQISVFLARGLFALWEGRNP
ncbi:MAG: S-layer homology domain-containing protein [Acidobacteria bacterium]|nr:S-layer homology domain-containing protein [Acidobacteriota bacterium]